MVRVGTARWEAVDADAAVSADIGRSCGIPLALARSLVARGFSTVQSADAYLAPRLDSMTDPFALDGMAAAVERIRKAVESGERIAIYGDYDADGVTSTALLVQVLTRLGGDVRPFLPNRFDEGYGLTEEGLDHCLADTQSRLVITADCGSGSAAAVRIAAARGVDVVVTDHHELHGEVAPGVAVVNPKRGADARLSPLAGVGVAFKLLHGLVKVMRDGGSERARALDLRESLDLVAVGTVADVALLTGENRTLVRAGLARLNRSPSVGLRALLRRASVRPPVDVRQLGFVVGPRLNAAGRLADVGPEESLSLLLAASDTEAAPFADRLEKANETRRRVEESVLSEALQQVSSGPPEGAVVAAGDGWHAGIIGIVAARLCSRFGCPTAVVSFDGEGQGRGSCRSTEGVNVVEALEVCGELLDTFGGHAMAAGFRIRRERLPAMAERFRAACGEQSRRTPRERVLRLDGWLGAGEAGRELMDGLERCEPFGPGNREPVWGMREATVAGPIRVVGERHVRFRACVGGETHGAIGFGMAEAGFAEGMTLDLAFRLRRDSYAGPGALQLQIEAVRPATS